MNDIQRIYIYQMEFRFKLQLTFDGFWFEEN